MDFYNKNYLPIKSLEKLEREFKKIMKQCIIFVPQKNIKIGVEKNHSECNASHKIKIEVYKD